jgi:hypothetical protein
MTLSPCLLKGGTRLMPRAVPPPPAKKGKPRPGPSPHRVVPCQAQVAGVKNIKSIATSVMTNVDYTFQMQQGYQRYFKFYVHRFVTCLDVVSSDPVYICHEGVPSRHYSAAPSFQPLGGIFYHSVAQPATGYWYVVVYAEEEWIFRSLLASTNQAFSTCQMSI